ncbi:jg18820, partial [Pararge aegeria aegeria]
GEYLMEKPEGRLEADLAVAKIHGVTLWQATTTSLCILTTSQALVAIQSIWR